MEIVVSTGEYINVTYSNKDMFILLNEPNDKLKPDDVSWVEQTLLENINKPLMDLQEIMEKRFPYGVQIVATKLW